MSGDDETTRLEQDLRAARPVPPAGWRGELRRLLVEEGVLPSRPRRLYALAAGFAGSGALLLGVAALSI